MPRNKTGLNFLWSNFSYRLILKTHEAFSEISLKFLIGSHSKVDKALQKSEIRSTLTFWKRVQMNPVFRKMKKKSHLF